MILTVLVGNTNTRLAWFKGKNIIRRQTIPSAKLLREINQLPLSPAPLGAALASVVPRATRLIYQYLSRNTPTLLVNIATASPLKICYNRRFLGADRLCAAVGGYLRYHRDLIVVDFGTAITLNIVHKEGVFLGGPIFPGVQMMLSALAQKTHRLPEVNFVRRQRLTVTTTQEAIQSGVFNLIVGGLHYMVNRLNAETKRNYFIVGTGGASSLFRKHLKLINRIDPDLTSRGLAALFYINRRKNE